MKIAVVAANGRVGQKVVAEAMSRGYDVTAFARGEENKSGASIYVRADIMDLTKDDLAGFDAVVDAVGLWKVEDLPMHTLTSQHLADLLSGTDARLLVVGGAGALYTNPEHTQMSVDSPDFPEAIRPVARAQAEEFAKMRTRDDVRWTFISPALMFEPDGPRTGSYVLAGEEATHNSTISYADYAIAMVDEIEKGNHIRQRFSVIGA